MIFNIPLLKSNILYEKKRHEGCRDHKLSVFFGGKNTKELKGIKSKDVKGWLKNRFSYNFVHIRKDPDWGHGFVHFENDDDKTRFYNYVRNKKFIGPLSKTIMFAEARPKGGDDDDYDDDDDDDNDDDDGRSNTQNQSLQSPVQPPLSQPSPQSSPLQLPPPQSPQSSPVQLPPPQSPQPSQSQLPAYNIFESKLIVLYYLFNINYIFIFNVKNLSVDVNINNTKLIFVKFEYDLPKDPEGSNCLLREAVFPDKEVILNLELPKRQVYILN
ncbi:hypothetical protein GLOIN_2v1791431 [Rhizophagus irregularis DAOM 181602=DAOM 197198]|nr:hypothetical protein GLOIN_2v1791431 [Rhizophagus irregularis DAOM 181602=DAOM 197198]